MHSDNAVSCVARIRLHSVFYDRNDNFSYSASGYALRERCKQTICILIFSFFAFENREIVISPHTYKFGLETREFIILMRFVLKNVSLLCPACYANNDFNDVSIGSITIVDQVVRSAPLKSQ